MARTRILRPYHFVDKNPIIDVMRSAVKEQGLIKKLDIVADLASLSRSTPKGWFDGEVRDPRHSSIMAVMLSLGYTNEWRKARSLDVEKELKVAREWLKRERSKTKKRKAA